MQSKLRRKGFSKRKVGERGNSDPTIFAGNFFKNICFTEFLGQVGIFDKWLRTVKENESVTFFVCQEEKCETTGRHHLQGYFQLKEAISLKELKEKYSETAHFEQRKGTHKQAMKYCLKEDSRVKDGLYIKYQQKFSNLERGIYRKADENPMEMNRSDRIDYYIKSRREYLIYKELGLFD